MQISHFIEEKILLVEITEELDHHETEKMRRRVDYEIQRFMPKKVVFDFNRVVFMDSAGIGFLLGRYKTAKIYGGQVELMNVDDKLKKILEMSGILKVINVLEKSNEVLNEMTLGLWDRFLLDETTHNLIEYVDDETIKYQGSKYYLAPMTFIQDSAKSVEEERGYEYICWTGPRFFYIDTFHFYLPIPSTVII